MHYPHGLLRRTANREPSRRASHVSKKYVDKTVCKKVRRAAAPFIAWLDEDEESDSEEEDGKDEADSA